ncbi:MAG: hypothetical protein JST38_09160 [Bacteroidetes bacterium]|nr:hypothetical protein [Bacteroidota bacterium]MBS1941031.1 hypothetical protein [Bacteroidota bacterium]
METSEYDTLRDGLHPFEDGAGFPTARQENTHDCGYACVHILAAYHGLVGIECPSLPETHLSIKDIMTFAAKVGFATHAFRTSYSWLREKVPPPYIVHWKGEHFVVVYRIDHSLVSISDPSTGVLREMTKQEFVRGWLGHINGPGSWKRGVVVFLEKKASNAQ